MATTSQVREGTGAESVATRKELLDSLRLDLVGPTNDHRFANELLPQAPGLWYLTGYLVPFNAPEDQRSSIDADDELDAVGPTGNGDEAEQPDQQSKRRSFLPSSIGLSVLVPPEAHAIAVEAEWGDYHFEIDGRRSDTTDDEMIPVPAAEPEPVPADGKTATLKGYRRVPGSRAEAVNLPKGDGVVDLPLDGAPEGMWLQVVSRTVTGAGALPDGTRSISVFLINRRAARTKAAYLSFAFQARLSLECGAGFVARPDPRTALLGEGHGDFDERLADLQYRDEGEFAIGHGVATEVDAAGGLLPNGRCRRVTTAWIPSAQVERVRSAELTGVELRMERLGELASVDAVRAALGGLVTRYGQWIQDESAMVERLAEPVRKSTQRSVVADARNVAARIERGIECLADAQALEAFRIANRAMAAQARRREARGQPDDARAVREPTWRPFQIAFILMALPGLVDPHADDRETVDLLFFPTGGGKTEAYLGLAACTLVLRRLRNPGPESGGVSVLMRYTLRLLTLDQLGRAAALICALELERKRQPDLLGAWPFEIGLWVGRASTPNRMGAEGDRDENSARTRVLAYQRDSNRHDTPIPLEKCPWCDTPFEPRSFQLLPNVRKPTDLRIVCRNPRCDFTGDRQLPIVAVDEPLYRRLPCFVIATVDKFASLPWVAEAGALLGKADRHDTDGFYGPAIRGGKVLPKPLLPPDLIIQDELHLISGPLGTIAGLYEGAIEELCTRVDGGRRIRPKIVASTATVRRAVRQIGSLFNRHQVCVFPSPGSNRRNSFFAITDSPSESPARLYVGIAAQGRSMKVVFLRTCLALLCAAERLYEREGGVRNPRNPVDPYMTLVGYFNSLRELGGSRRIAEDDIVGKAAQYRRRRRREPEDHLFIDRDVSHEPVELTSRVSTGEVADAKRRLELPHSDENAIDIALATNMISVGLDITRLGLMVVLGQPKSSAEYIQATSRVGRDPNRPGLVVTLLNAHKPRDRSHYERFDHFHTTFYRTVESTSVTPYTPRALDRALAATLVSLCRHAEAELTPSEAAGTIATIRDRLDRWAERLAARAGSEAGDPMRAAVLHRSRQLLDAWMTLAKRAAGHASRLRYEAKADGAERLLRDFLDPDLEGIDDERRLFRANRSMRDVEPTVNLLVKTLGGRA